VSTKDVEPHARAVLEMWLGGQASGGAAADILFGIAEPGGRLAETIPRALSDTPSYLNFPGTPEQVLYGERLYVGYRLYDTTGRDVAHPFGHGLSYTTFTYTELTAEVPDPTRNEAIIAFTVTNTGQRTGSEVAQVYVTDPVSSIDRPERELKAFRKVRLAPGESQRIGLPLTERAFAFWDQQRHAWTVEPGTFGISVGASSRDLRLSADIELTVEPTPIPLTLDSTVGEWMARPQARNALVATMAEAADGRARSIAGDDAVLQMVASLPLRRFFKLGLIDLSPDRTADLLGHANEGIR